MQSSVLSLHPWYYLSLSLSIYMTVYKYSELSCLCMYICIYMCVCIYLYILSLYTYAYICKKATNIQHSFLSFHVSLSLSETIYIDLRLITLPVSLQGTWNLVAFYHTLSHRVPPFKPLSDCLNHSSRSFYKSVRHLRLAVYNNTPFQTVDRISEGLLWPFHGKCWLAFADKRNTKEEILEFSSVCKALITFYQFFHQKRNVGHSSMGKRHPFLQFWIAHRLFHEPPHFLI